MAQATKILTALNEDITFDIPTDDTAVVGVESQTAGDNSIVLEGNMGGAWFTIQMSKPDGTAPALLITGAGVGYADVSYCDKIRVRKSAIGVGAVPVTVKVNLSTRAAN